MNKELFSENGEFISSRLASKKIGYSHDHISALIRSGKVSGKKVGRVWLVDFHSLENYKKSIDLKNFEPGKISGQMRSYTFKTKNHLGKNFLSVEKASKKIGYSQDHIGALVRGGKVAGQKIGRVWYVDFRSLRRHKKSQRIIFRQNVQKPTTNVPPIEPRLSLPHPISQKVIKYEEEVAPKFVEVSKDKYKIKKELLLRELLGGALITSMLIMVVTLASVSGIKQIAKTDTFNKLADGSISAEISQGLNNTSASILATISDGLQNLWNNLFGKKENTVLVVVPPDSLSNKEPTLKPSTSEGSGKTTIINNPPAQTIINEYKSITQVTPLDLTLDDVVNNGDTTRLDVRLLGNVEIGKNLNIKGSIVSGSSVIAKNGSFSSLSTSGDFSAGGEITLGNPEDNFIINSKNVSIDKDGNTTFLGNFFSANASTTNVYAVNSTSTNSYISLLTGDIATITNFTGTNNTLTNLIYTNATGTNSTTTNLFANSGVITNLNTNNLSLGTTSTSANINIVQTSNGSTTIQANRITDAAPAGDFIRYNNAANDTTLFRVDNSGNLYAGGIINSGSQTITSTSQPQFRVQYDASNENTNSISATGVSTFGFNGSTPRAIFTPQLNATNSFTFTDLSSTPIFNIDTLNQIVSAPHFLSTSSTTLQNFTFINATGTSATTTNLYTTLLVAGSATTTNLFSTNGAFTNLLSSYATTTNLYSSGQTILAGTSGNVGIGTTNPTNALSFGNSQNQKIWVENSTNVIAGRALTLSAGSTVNTGLVDFAPLSQANLNWWSMAAAPSGNVYAAAYNNNLYKQTNGTGNFVAQGLNGGLWGVAVAPNGNVYVAKHNDDIYMQTNETGSFVALGQTPSSWGAMAAAPSGNVYALKVYSGAGLYKQTNGTGDFNLVVSGSWNAVAVAPNGNVYLVGSSDIYMQTNETGSFVALGQGAKSWQSVTVAPNGDVYAVVYGGDVYRQTGGTGNFVALGQISRNWQSMAAAPNGNIYAGVGGGDIYMNVAQGGTADLAGGNLILSAGVGKGTGASNISFLTGTTLTSGTTLQALSEKMTILGNGNVGIGTTSPTYKLSVEGSSTLGNQAIAGYFTATSTTATSTFAGAVGIGTTNPTRAFEIVGNVENNNTGTASQLSIRGTASTIDKLNIGYNTTSNFGFIEAVRESSVTQNLILGPVGGNVGIGITNPNSKLAVNGTIAIAATVSTSIPQTLIWSRQSDNWTPASIGQLYDGSTYGGYLVFNTHTSNLTIGDQATPLERMRIDSSGNVGIGTTSPAYKLSVEGS